MPSTGRNESCARTTTRELPAGEMPECLNCGTHLRGQYCGNCGQRGRSRLISLWELVRDAFGDLFELDSRLWKTLVPLLAKPGMLTHDYLQGRRARYMPPFRMYLVLSLLFFLVAFFNPRETFGVFYEPEVRRRSPGSHRRRRTARRTRARRTRYLPRRRKYWTNSPPRASSVKTSPRVAVSISNWARTAAASAECEMEDFSVDGPDWLTRSLTRERAQLICKQIKQDGGRSFLANVLDNIPVALIILLPIMAFVLKALYPLSRRYYVEHLLFFVHFHAFFFLILILMILLRRLNCGLADSAKRRRSDRRRRLLLHPGLPVRVDAARLRPEPATDLVSSTSC